jgi:hypothetical protein
LPEQNGGQVSERSTKENETVMMKTETVTMQTKGLKMGGHDGYSGRP